MNQLTKLDLTVAFISTAIVALCLSNGLGHTFDSDLYLSGAEHLRQNGLDNLFSLGAFKAKPPLFPVFIALLGNNILLITLSNLIFHIASVLISFYLINEIFKDQNIRIILKFLVALGTPIVLIHDFLLPEPMFMVFWNFQLLTIYKIQKSPSSMLMVSILVSSIFIIGLRHIGIVPVFISGTYIFFLTRNTPFKRLGLINIFVPIILFFLWQFLVYSETEHFNRLDHTSGLNFFRNLYQVLLTLTHWFIPTTQVFYVNIALIAILGSLLLVLLYFSVGIEKIIISFKSFLFIQSTGLILLIILKGDLIFSDIERYLSLIYIPLLILVLSGISELRNRCNPLFNKATIVFLYTWLIYPLLRLANNVILWSGLI